MNKQEYREILEYELINMIYDLLVDNPVKGVYLLDREDLLNMVDSVDSTDNTITIKPNLTSTYILKLIHTHESQPIQEVNG